MNSKQDLNDGVEILKPLMGKHDFTYIEGDSGVSSGGLFASGCFKTCDRRFKFSVRYTLGHVYYEVFGRRGISHEDYMRAVKALGYTTSDPQYPAASQGGGISDSFRRLYNDIKNASTFFSESDDKVEYIFDWVENNPKKKGLGAV
ncbi:MAG: hypothetical protein KZQ89_17775 [Candidatus Thiodiazotropha sp. (ex Lucinoma kastoroae)]|nr:hypothetical protein [Candidatus Thiodiazotropha sp. (ex Troendleina suluensis)]MCU7849803.1 hypothetical protein [Candidatus Thiodiazotropha sp. (ex Lucinoma kastoroae)]MCU7861523.1 hypothetical protein [Candidatus Thiodiazotropha sp. (ex Lucinoma kastoroae)]